MDTKTSTDNHPGGNKIKESKVLKRLIDQYYLYVKVEESKDPQGYERKLIDAYIDEFGEKPPLNG
jgi:hypothetical protein